MVHQIWAWRAKQLSPRKAHHFHICTRHRESMWNDSLVKSSFMELDDEEEIIEGQIYKGRQRLTICHAFLKHQMYQCISIEKQYGISIHLHEARCSLPWLSGKIAWSKKITISSNFSQFFSKCPIPQISIEMQVWLKQKSSTSSRIEKCRTHVETLYKCVWVA